MKVFLIAGIALATVLAAAYSSFAVFFSANAKASAQQADRESQRAQKSNKRKGAGA